MDTFNTRGTGSERPRPHVVLLASPSAGHQIPLAELARRLVEHHGFAVTLVTFANFPLPAHVVASCIPPATVATAVLPAVDMDDVPAHEWHDIIQVFVQLVRRSLPNLRDLLRRIHATAGPLAAFVPDIFCSEALLVAGDVGVPGYFFLPSNLNWLALERRFVELHRGLPPGEYRDFPEDVEFAEGVSLHRTELPVVFRNSNSLDFQRLLVSSRRYLLADGFLVNTFDEMEPALVEAFKVAAEQGTFPPVFATGPLIRPSKQEPDVDDRHCLCLEWLDRQPIGSVVYVSFSTLGGLSLEQTTEVAAGLEGSGQRFLWVVRMPNLALPAAADGDPLALLPEGFLERTAARGLAVTAWTPQVRVLSHPATAAFLSHCGWNSTLESVQSGVPMVTLPMGADQTMNAAILEEKLGMALRPSAREDGIVGREEIATAVKELLVEGERRRDARRRAGEMQQAAVSAWLPEGSSCHALEEVATNWKTACDTKTQS
ncbi:hydroquinone glucosyltransferase-like [Lolium perenne]|uniref:hydroquinone glucosyltransferase-like n=1 Tax=Lolium perenne TaxID=4522 RepID=UPI0021EA0CD6|nr:hydroquinone glucosyltransferase-like [Lolium perenne]